MTGRDWLRLVLGVPMTVLGLGSPGFAGGLVVVAGLLLILGALFD